MVKIALEIFACIGVVTIYIFAIFVTTMIAVEVIYGTENADENIYAKSANVIQLFVVMAFLIEKVMQYNK